MVESLADADPADAVILAELATGSADETRAELEGLAKHLTARRGGLASRCRPRRSWPAAPARSWTARPRCSASAATWCCATCRRCGCTGCATPPADAALAERLGPAGPHEQRAAHRADAHRLQRRRRGRDLPRRGRAARGRTTSRLWLLPALAAAPVAAFFRDPERDVPADPDAVVAASDGKVLSVERIRDERLGDDEFLRIAVFLSVLDVHVNRAPVAGRVVDHFVVDGGFAAAMKPEAEHNVAALHGAGDDPRHRSRWPSAPG